MKELQTFINHLNAMRKLFKEPELVLETLTDDDKKSVAQSLASALSPEALTCDGEIRGAKLQAKAKMLNAAKAQLESLGVKVEVL